MDRIDFTTEDLSAIRKALERHNTGLLPEQLRMENNPFLAVFRGLATFFASEETIYSENGHLGFGDLSAAQVIDHAVSLYKELLSDVLLAACGSSECLLGLSDKERRSVLNKAGRQLKPPSYDDEYLAQIRDPGFGK